MAHQYFRLVCTPISSYSRRRNSEGLTLASKAKPITVRKITPNTDRIEQHEATLDVSTPLHARGSALTESSADDRVRWVHFEVGERKRMIRTFSQARKIGCDRGNERGRTKEIKQRGSVPH